MKKFQFRLATALSYRERRVDELKALLGKAIAALNEEKGTLLRCQQQQGLSLDEATRQAGNLLVRQTLPETMNALRHMEKKIQDTIKRHELSVYDVQQKLTAAMQDQKTLETLKEKQWQAYKQLWEKAEEQTLADITQSRWQPR